jgi:pimeloyl-ACP methyl ester carboxylesterase
MGNSRDQTGHDTRPSPAHPYPPPGRLVDVGGYHLHINCSGEGKPTVVIDSGLGDFSLGWSLVQPEVAKFTRVCTYDRAGYGWSDSGPKPRTSQQIVKELHTLLANAGIEKPYVLVGQSGGGLNLRLYASQYPGEVVGMVLVDPAHEEQWSRLPPQVWKVQIVNMRVIKFLSFLTKAGLLGMFGRLTGPPGFVQKLPSEVQPMYLAAFSTQYFNTFLDEFASLEESFAQVRTTGTLGNIPLTVLTGGNLLEQSQVRLPASLPMEEAKQVWVELHAELANLSSNSTHIVAEQCGHGIHIDQPELVIDAIHRVVKEAHPRTVR